MSKVITSPLPRWAGTVEITDNPTWEQIDAFEETLDISLKEGEKIFYSVLDRRNLPAVLAWVEKWNLENFPDPVTAENFPRVPSADRHKLVDLIYGEIRRIYLGVDDIPNG